MSFPKGDAVRAHFPEGHRDDVRSNLLLEKRLLQAEERRLRNDMVHIENC